MTAVHMMKAASCKETRTLTNFGAAIPSLFLIFLATIAILIGFWSYGVAKLLFMFISCLDKICFYFTSIWYLSYQIACHLIGRPAGPFVNYL